MSLPQVVITPDNRRSIEEAANEVFRELQVRRRIYGRWVQEGKLTLLQARERGERMEAALHYLCTHPDIEVGFAPHNDAPEPIKPPWESHGH